jgi:hypothetical protein
VVYDYADGNVLLTNVVAEPATPGLTVAAFGLHRRGKPRAAA